VQIIPPFLLALASALVLVPVCRTLAVRFGFVATPREDRWHKRPIALLGGVAIAASLVAVYGSVVQLRVLLAAVALMFTMGLADDLWSLKPATKLVIEIGVASMFLFFGYRLNWTHGITLDSMLTLFWIVGLTNAFNLLDNMDGLCAGVAFIAGAAFLVGALPVGVGSPAFFDVRYLAGLLGALLGFLVYNVHPATIFMGDSGSLVIGVSLAGLTLTLGSEMASRQSVLSVIAVPVLVLLIPIFDTTLVTVSRILSGRPTSVGGRDHSSHRLVAIGLSERSAVMLIWLLAAIGGAIGLAVSRAESWWSIVAVLFLLAMTIFAIYLSGIRVYESSDAAALERGGLTPIVVDFVYKRRVAEVLLDFMLVIVSYYSAYRLKYEMVEFASNFPYFLQSLPLVLTLQLAAFFVVGVYRGVWRHFGSSDAVTIVEGAVAGTVLSDVVIRYFYRLDRFSHTVFVIDGLVLVLMIIASRTSFRVIADALQRRRQAGRRLVIYGAGDGGAMAVRELLNAPDRDVRIMGFIDDDPRKQRTWVRGYPVVGAFEALPGMILAGSVDAIVLSMRNMDELRLRELRKLCVAHAIELSRLWVGLEPLIDPDHDSAIRADGIGDSGRSRQRAATRSSSPTSGKQ
jgi:UDP-GlcNAc:undecaprenyl-phosphate GlcNAc-1-phosphate transferase